MSGHDSDARRNAVLARVEADDESTDHGEPDEPGQLYGGLDGVPDHDANAAREVRAAWDRYREHKRRARATGGEW